MASKVLAWLSFFVGEIGPGSFAGGSEAGWKAAAAVVGRPAVAGSAGELLRGCFAASLVPPFTAEGIMAAAAAVGPGIHQQRAGPAAVPCARKWVVHPPFFIFPTFWRVVSGVSRLLLLLLFSPVSTWQCLMEGQSVSQLFRSPSPHSYTAVSQYGSAAPVSDTRICLYCGSSVDSLPGASLC